jgi:peptidoglycan/xylan/chitin deacetylase (PgdA/CDA1 family)
MHRGLPEIATLIFHEVTDEPLGSGLQRHTARRYAFTRQQLDHHLEHIAAGPVAPSLVHDVDLTRPGRHLLLTFDDGGRSARDAADALERHGWRGHFFVITNRIGGQTFLRASDIRALRAGGHVVGTHSHTHPDIFPDLSEHRMLEEWRVSTAILENLLGEPIRTASVPGGDISPAVLESATAAGLDYLFTSEPWLRTRRVGGCWMLGRFCVKAGTSPRRVGDLVAFRGWKRARLERQLKVLARRGMGPLYRLYVYRTTRHDRNGHGGPR